MVKSFTIFKSIFFIRLNVFWVIFLEVFKVKVSFVGKTGYFRGFVGSGGFLKINFIYW